MELETKKAIDMLHKIKQCTNLIFDLRRQAEHVRVILHESPNTSETSEGARSLVSVYDTKFCHANRKFLVAPVPGVKDEAVTRAVHGFQCPLLFLHVKGEHVVLVVLPVPRSLPQLRVVHIRRDD